MARDGAVDEDEMHTKQWWRGGEVRVVCGCWLLAAGGGVESLCPSRHCNAADRLNPTTEQRSQREKL